MAIRAAVCVGVPLLVLWGLDRLDLSVFASFGAFAALYGRFEGFRDRLLMQISAAAVVLASMLIGTSLAVFGLPLIVRVVVLAAVAALVTLISHVFRWHPPGALFAVFAGGATATLPVDASAFIDVLVVGGASVAFSLAVTVVMAFVGRTPWRSESPLVRAVADRQAGAVALTVGIGVLLAGIAGLLIVGSHWYWAMVGAVAALGGAHVNARIIRGLQRLIGTVLGVFIAAGLLALDLPPIVTVLVAVLCQAGAEMFVSRNYGIAMLFITPLALLMIEMAVPVEPEQLLSDRLLDTVVGVLVGTLVAVVSAGFRRRSLR